MFCEKSKRIKYDQQSSKRYWDFSWYNFGFSFLNVKRQPNTLMILIFSDDSSGMHECKVRGITKNLPETATLIYSFGRKYQYFKELKDL